MAMVAAAPWFSGFLMLAGILWLCCVGESRYAIRHPVMPYVGWGVVGLLAFAFWSVLIAGYVAVHVPQQMAEEAQAKIDSLNQTNQQLQQKMEALGQALEREVSPWGLTDDQKKKLADALNKVPPGVTYTLNIHVIPNCSRCSIYMTELGEVWEKVPGWKIQGGPNFGLDPRVVGVLVPIDMENCPAEELQLVMSALGEAGMKPERARAEGKLGSECVLLVGSRPKQ
jgi:hypothetical protein